MDATESDSADDPVRGTGMLAFLQRRADRRVDFYVQPVIRIGGRDVSTGTLPGARLHRRHLSKIAGPLCAVEFARSHVGPLPVDGGVEFKGRWHIVVDDARLTGGSWWMAASDGRVEVGMDVDERWRPGRLPPLMRLVTTVMPMFRRWPTTCRWRAGIEPGTPSSMTSGWERVGGDDGRLYRRATRS